MDIKVTTNNRERELVTYDDLSLKDQRFFDYVTDHSETRFFKAYGEYYDLYEFDLAPSRLRAKGWDGVQNQSFFSAIVVRYFDKDGHEFDGTIVAGYATW